MELVKGEFFEVSGINCSIENPSFVTAVISAAQFRFSRPWYEPNCDFHDNTIGHIECQHFFM
jgi:hypothetical protein